MLIRETFQIPVGYPTLVKGNFLKTGNLQSLPTFDHLNEIRSRRQVVMASRVQPSGSPAQDFNGKFTCLKVCAIQIGDLQLPACRRLELSCSGARMVIEKIQTRDCKIGFGIGGLFFQ